MNILATHLRKAFLGTFVLALAACSSPVIPESGATYVGQIVAAGTDLGLNDDFRIDVKANLDEECGIRFRVADRTQVFDSRGLSTAPASTEILEVGSTVSVGYDGIFGGCPSSANAETIERRR